MLDGDGKGSGSSRAPGGTGTETEPPVASQARQFLQMDFRSQVPEMDDLTVLERLRSWCQEALDKHGKIAGLVAIARVANAYGAMSKEERDAFFQMLKRDFSADETEVQAAVDSFRAAAGTGKRDQALARLHLAVESPRLHLFRQFNTIPESLKFLVDLRADISSRLRQYPDLWLMELELRHLLESWFNLGFLQLRRITWESPAALLEKIITYEAVHEFTHWKDLKRRLESDRTCFAFIHPAMPNEPIIFLQVALVQGVCGSIQDLLDPSTPELTPHLADTAIFYSITNAQKGLRGIPFGNLLIKQVAAELRSEVPSLEIFSTLSPIPRFRKDYLEPALASSSLDQHYTTAEDQLLRKVADARSASAAVRKLLDRPDWHEDHVAADALRPGLLRAARAYLGEEEHRGRAACPVAHFHASNGAMLARINWLGDTSTKGLAQSAGIMVNYLYDMEKFDEHQSEYARTGRLLVGEEVMEL